jgi:hypothetical protein
MRAFSGQWVWTSRKPSLLEAGGSASKLLNMTTLQEPKPEDRTGGAWRVRLDVRLTTGTEHDRAMIKQRLEETPGIEAIDAIEREAKADGNEDGGPAEYG